MEALLLRTGSVPVHNSPAFRPRSPRLSLSRNDSFSGNFSGDKNDVSSPRFSLHLEFSRKRGSNSTPIRRAFSETDVTRSETALRSRSFVSARIPEEEEEEEETCYGSFGRLDYAGARPERGIPVEELEFSGGGFGRGKKSGGGNNSGRHGGNDAFSDCHGSDIGKIGDYYKQMLKSNPGDSLLLRNYGKFLHEVEGDMEKAEEYYGRAILASPGDGELLSLYGKLIWDTQKNEERAKSYFDRAVFASPNDCMVLGSYAHFMWEAEEDEEDEFEGKAAVSTPAMVAAF